jgi:lipoprotein signal peptidase
VAVTPLAEIPEFLYFGVIVLLVVFDWETQWIIDSHVAAEAEENARGLVGKEL